MAVEALDFLLSQLKKRPIYIFHEIVHNKHIVERFRKSGAVFVESIEEVPVGEILLFSAHGVSPAVRASAATRRLVTIDATCPLVTKVHMEAIKFARQGYDIIFIGHAGHDEVLGTMGEAPDRIRLVENEKDVDCLERVSTKMVYLTQTTLSVDDAERIIQRLKKKFPDIVGPAREDICYATQNRQSAVRELSKDVDLVLVVGSHNSSNSIRLTEVTRENGVPSILINGPEELNLDFVGKFSRVLVTAGASAPDDLVWSVITSLQNKVGATLSEIVVQEENVHFPPPKELRDSTALPG